MTLGLWGFGPFDTSFLPAVGLWDAFSNVTVIAGGGRSGAADDNCAAFDTSLNSVLSRNLTPGAVAGAYTATYGLALRVLTVTSSGDPLNPNVTTIASIWTANSHIDLVVLDTGALRLRQVLNGVLLGTICETVANVVPIGTGGLYIEVQIQFVLGVASGCQIHVSDQSGTMNPLVQGALLGADAGPYTTFRLGGGVGEAAATFRITDVYINDGVPAATPLFYKGQPTYNNTFFGNTHVEAFYPTADGTNLTVNNEPWTPDTGTVEYVRIDEHPPDEDASYDFAGDAGQLSTFAFQSPRTAPFGRFSCLGMAPIFALQWIGRMRNTSEVRTVRPIVREIITGTIAGDALNIGTLLSVGTETYLYYDQIYDRNPITGDPWSFDVLFPISVGAVGTYQFGLRLS